MAKSLKEFLNGTNKQLQKLRSAVKNLKKAEYENDEKRPSEPKPEKQNETLIHISGMSVFRATIIVLALLTAYQFIHEISQILMLFFVAVLLAAALDPTIDALEKYKIPRSISVIFMFILSLGFIVFFISQLIPLVANQLIELAKNLNGMILKVADGNSQLPFSSYWQPWMQAFLQEIDKENLLSQVKTALESLSEQLQSIAGNTLGSIKSVFNGILNFLLVLILTFFLVMDERSVDGFFVSLFPSKHGKYIIEKIEAVKHKIGYWLRGQVILMISIFLITWLGFTLLGVEYALTLAMLSGLLEIVPVVGPLMAMLPVLLVAVNESAWLALWAFIFLIAVQQIEGNVLVPLIMKKAVGLSPIIVLLAMLIGFESLGVLGAIISIPVATSLAIFVNDYTVKKK